MRENIIIVLENNERYIILDKIIFEKREYYFGMGIKNDLDVINDSISFFEEKIEDNDIYISKVLDEKILVNLIKKAKVNNK